MDQPPTIRIVVGAALARIYNETCFICESDDLNDEHVPAESMGGDVLLRSCVKCNSKLGSYADEPLRRYVFHDYEARMTDPAGEMRGKRRVPIRFTTDSDGVATGAVTKLDHDADLDLLRQRGGAFEFTAREPDRLAVLCGLLKNSYLAESAILGRPVRGERADAARARLRSLIDGESPDTTAFEPLAVIYSHKDLPPTRRSRPRFAAGRSDHGGDVVPVISFGIYAAMPYFLDDQDLADEAERWIRDGRVTA